MSEKTKHQHKHLASDRFQKLARQCGFHAVAKHLRSKGYSFDEAHELLFGSKPNARELTVEQAKQLGFEPVPATKRSN